MVCECKILCKVRNSISNSLSHSAKQNAELAIKLSHAHNIHTHTLDENFCSPLTKGQQHF